MHRLSLVVVVGLFLVIAPNLVLATPEDEALPQNDDGVCLPTLNFNHNTSQRLAAEFGFGCGSNEHRLPYISYETGQAGDKLHLGIMGSPEHTDMPVIFSVSFTRLRMHDSYLSFDNRQYYSGIEIKVSAIVILFKVGLLLEERSRKPMFIAGIGVGI